VVSRTNEGNVNDLTKII